MMQAMLPMHNRVISGEPVKQPTISERMLVRAEMRMDGPISDRTYFSSA